MPVYRVGLPAAPVVSEVRVEVIEHACHNHIEISYAVTDGVVTSLMSEVLVVPEPGATVGLLAGAVLLSLLKRRRMQCKA